MPAWVLAYAEGTRMFIRIGEGNGLEAQVATTLLVDRQGLLWVGSREGLYRYDGYKAEAFSPDLSDPKAISDIDIRCLFQANDGSIWIGTNNGGLNMFDPLTNEFHHYRHDSGDSRSLPNDRVYGLGQDSQGLIWVATQNGVASLDRESGEFKRYAHDSSDPGTLSNNWAYSFHTGSDGRFWVSTVGGGVNRWNAVENRFDRFDLAGLAGADATLNNVYSMHQDKAGFLWVGTQSGLAVLDPETGNVTMAELSGPDRDQPVISMIQADHHGRLWITTMASGLLVMDMSSKRYELANSDPPGAEGNLPDQAQMSLALSEEMVFIGTWGNGVYRGTLEKPGFALLGSQNVSGGIRNRNISAVLPGDKVGEPWIGSFGGGIQKLGLEQLAVIGEGPAAAATKGVLNLMADDRQRIFAATTEGMYVFDREGALLAHDKHVAGMVNGLGEGRVSALLADEMGTWIGVSGTGLYFRDDADGSFRAYRHEPGQRQSLSADNVTVLLDGPDDQLWVGTLSNGLNLCRKVQFSCQRFPGNTGGGGELSHFSITSLFTDRRGRTWIGTDGGGLNLVAMDEAGSVVGFEHWGRDEGLLSDGIMGIEEDLDESLWLSTRRGLSRFNPITGSIVNFVRESGLPVTHFNANASAADEKYIYFGSVEGLMVLEKGSLLREREPATVLVRRVLKIPKNTAPISLGEFENGIEVPFGDVLAMEFALLDYSEAPGEYSYRLRADGPWSPQLDSRSAIFHGIAPATYQFQVKARDSYGLWAYSKPIELKVVPPFWMTAWFRLSLALAMIALGVGLHKLRSSRQKRTAREIQRLGARRETALEEFLGSEAELAVLTPRQKEVLQLIAEGYSTREIADLLDVSIKTVEAHRANLMERLDIHDIPGLVRLAIRARLVSSHS